MSSSSWRLVLSPPATGAENMAIDEAILESVAAGHAPPTLRLYAWVPPCLSLGYAQPVAQVDPLRLAERGWDLVRRPTGGRAILHTDELTYSVSAAADNPHVAGGVLASYRHLSAGLTRALLLLGLRVEVQPQERLDDASRQNPVCFEVPSAYEITVAGKKLVGSAQTRRMGGVLQHGSLPLGGDIARITEVLRYESPSERAQAADQVRARAATVGQLLGHTVTWDDAARAMAGGFRETLGIDLETGDLTQDEMARSHVRRSQRYQHPDWTERN
jgi:lipoate-protein ligase A